MKAYAESPCKTIITGEHFVVHGGWALAAAVDRKVIVSVQKSERFAIRSDRFGLSRSALRPAARLVEAMAREFSFKPSLSVEIQSEIPDGAGLGSSAATMVALASALARLESLRLGIREIIDFAMVGER